MKRLLLLASPLILSVGCYGGERYNTGECPAGETCSDLTPKGLQFVGNHLVNDILLSGPRATAIGGTQVVALQYDRGDGVTVALDIPFTADDDGGNGVKVSAQSGSQVTMLGAGSRTNYLRILDQDGLLMDRKELTGAALDKIELVPDDFESIPNGSDLAFAAGDRKLGVALYGDVQHSAGPISERIVDTTMSLDLAGATKTAWDTLEINAQVGRSYLSVTAGDKAAAMIDFVVVDHADALAAIDPVATTIMPNGSQSICFAATMADTNGPRYIAGLTWAFNVDGQTKTQGDGVLTRNCIGITTTKTTGTVSVQATAGGQSATVVLAVGTAARSIAPAGTGVHTAAEAVPTAGDRAAM